MARQTIKIKCSTCGELFTKDKATYTNAISKNQVNFYCNKVCSNNQKGKHQKNNILKRRAKYKLDSDNRKQEFLTKWNHMKWRSND